MLNNLSLRKKNIITNWWYDYRAADSRLHIFYQTYRRPITR